MKKKAIFGGTFDPIHNGHLHIAYEALYKLGLDKIIFMPSGNPPHKMGVKKTEANIRYELVKMAIRDEKKFELSDYEIVTKGLSYTYKTLEYFKEVENNTSWYFLTGVDCLFDLHKWKSVDRILNAASLLVFNRPGFEQDEIIKRKNDIETLYGKEIIFLDLPLLDISSTEIKKMISQGRNVDYLLPKSVYNTVIELGLYEN